MSATAHDVDGRTLFTEARQRLLDDRRWLDYVRRIYRLSSGDHPFLTYVGLNFTESTIKNYKFYFSFFRRLSPREVQVALPVENRSRFDAVYRRWQPTQEYDTIHRGATFALKVAADGSLTHYYHLRLKGLPAGEPQRLKLSRRDYGQLHGVCEEFERSSVRLKRYYYCQDPQTIRSSLEAAGFSDFVREVPRVDLLEYIESDQRDKLTWITDSQPLLSALVERRGPPHLHDALEMFCRRLGFLPFGPGSARDGHDHSVYFVLPSGPAAAGGYVFDGVQRFVTRYLRLDDPTR